MLYVHPSTLVAKQTLQCPHTTLQVIHTHLDAAMKSGRYTNYSRFGMEIEDDVRNIVRNVLRVATPEVVVTAPPSKNHFPDIDINGELAVDIKVGNHMGVNSKRKTFVHKGCAATDLGTMLDYQTTKVIGKTYKEIYFIFIEYRMACAEDLNANAAIVRVTFQPFYKYVGLSDKGVSGIILKYREKDGNLRPRPYKEFLVSSEDPQKCIQDYEHFTELLRKTITYRANKLVCKHIMDMDERDVCALLREVIQRRGMQQMILEECHRIS